MEISGTVEAFKALISERGIYKKLGVERSTVAGWKIYLREGKSISLDKMEEMLIKGGAKVVSEKVWEVGPEVNELGHAVFSVLPDSMKEKKKK